MSDLLARFKPEAIIKSLATTLMVDMDDVSKIEIYPHAVSVTVWDTRIQDYRTMKTEIEL